MEDKTINIEEAAEIVERVSKRIALLHLSYAKMITEELGEERGKRLILRAIKDYGKTIGRKRREEIEEMGLKPTPENFSKGTSLSIPPFGMHSKIEDKENMKAYGCTLGRLWKEYGEDKLGKLYCYVDATKYMGFNQDYVQTHTKAMTLGDDFCEFVVTPSTKKQKDIFNDDEADLSEVDEYLKE